MFRVIVILCMVILSSTGVMKALEPASITLPLLTMSEGQTSELVAQIDCTTAVCGAFDITIQFDPEVLQVNAMALGAFWGGQVFTARKTINNNMGVLRYAATKLGDPVETNETALLILEVTTLKPGTSQLRIVHLDMGNDAGDPMEVVSIDGGVVVSAEIDMSTAGGDLAETCEYQVRTGDTLFGIALANDVSVDDILALNDIPNRTIIRVGDVLTIPGQECATAIPAASQSNGRSTIIEVYDCRHLGNNVFEWYSARRNFDSSGNPISETRIAGPFTGEWQPGCPAGEQPSTSSGGSSSSGSGSGSSGGSSGGGDDDDGGLGVCIGPLCL